MSLQQEPLKPDVRKSKIQVQNLFLTFGGVKALNDISFDIMDNEILAIIGPNGAGKTCFLNCLNGFYKPQKGEIYFEGQRITRIRPDKAAKLGLARTFQNIELFSGLSTLDNIMAARHVLMKRSFVSGAFYFGPAHEEEIEHRRTVEDIIDFLEISDEFYKIAGMIKEIYDKLKKGIAIIALQKNPKAEFGIGGARSIEKARLYVTLEKGIAKIVSGKNWASETNPNGLYRTFKLVQGAKFITQEGWKRD